MATPDTKLGPKHLKALELMAEGRLPLKEIAKICGWAESYFYDLVEGNAEKTSNVAFLFSAEVDKINAKNTKRIKSLSKDIQRMILSSWDAKIKNEDGKQLTEDEEKQRVAIYNAIAKATPNVEIGSFSYTKGLSAEDLVNEFKRLKSLASDSRGVRSASPGRTREILDSSSGRSTTSQE
jgi:hypothetical protein